MSQNTPLLSRVLGTAALASVIVVLLMAPMGPHSRAFHDTSDAASREVIFATAD